MNRFSPIFNSVARATLIQKIEARIVDRYRKEGIAFQVINWGGNWCIAFSPITVILRTLRCTPSVIWGEQHGQGYFVCRPLHPLVSASRDDAVMAVMAKRHLRAAARKVATDVVELALLLQGGPACPR